MTIQRFLKKCDEFFICSETGNAGDVFYESIEERKTLFQIIVKGSGKIAKLFDSEYEELNDGDKNFVNLKKYAGYETIFKSYEDFHLYGFNYLNDDDWDGKLVRESFIGDDRSWLICFDGHPIVNDILLTRNDDAKLEKKNYNVEIKDGILGLFTKL